MIALIRNILNVFQRHGLWDEGVMLVGSWCYVFYERHFGARNYPFKTEDVDFLVPFPYRGRKSVNLAKDFEAMGFKEAFKSGGAIYFYNPEFKIEFICPERGKESRQPKSIKPLGLQVDALRFVEMLLEDPVTVQEEGLAIRVPNPVNFCLHKLVIAQRRKKSYKRAKDIEQAIHVMSILSKEAFKSKFEKLPAKWRTYARKSLAQGIELNPLEERTVREYLDTLQKR